MNILIIGNGGREHALAWKVAQSESVSRVFVAPGNGGTALEPKVENLAIALDDIEALVSFAKDSAIDLTIVGPEIPLVMGVVDAFQANNLAIFGPTKAAAALEGSKAFSKEFLTRHQIPTADFQTFTEIEPALAYVREKGAPIVIKADGLAAGKGVVVATDLPIAEEAIYDMLAGNRFGDAGHRVVIEEFLDGEEASFIVMVDGKHVLPLATSQDHKRLADGDTGPNTGGMGAYSPAPVVTADIYDKIMQEVIYPTVKGMEKDGTPYTGFLYAGLMIMPDGSPKVIEYNCRLGDPETQPIMLRLQSDLVSLCQAALNQKLDSTKASWDERAAVGVVLAAGGYPDTYEKDLPIKGLIEADAVSNLSKVFHAGTRTCEQNEQAIVTNGGRVLCVTALGESVAKAQALAYQSAAKISWEGCFYRKDIGYRAIARELDAQKEPALTSE